MARERKDVVQFRWQAEGKPDPQPEIIKRGREDLALAHYSDDELANYADMHGNRSDQEEFKVMMDTLNPDSVHLPRIVILTAVKERIKWLSRQLAIAQGTYPGTQKLTNEELVQRAIDAPIIEAIKHFDKAKVLGADDPAAAYPKIDLDPELFKGPIAGSYADGIEGLADELGESRSSGKTLLSTKPLSQSDYFHNMQRELSNRKGMLLWGHNVEHFLKYFDAKLSDFHDHLRHKDFVEGIIIKYPLLNKENIRAALTVVIGMHNGAAYRWDSYVRLCQDLLAEYKVYIPFDGDHIADNKLGNGLNVITKSRYHGSGQAVQYPAGVIEDRMVAQRQMYSHSVEGEDTVTRDGETTRRIPTGFEVEIKPAVALTDEETKNAHTLWFKESQELLEKIGMKAPSLGSTMMYNQRQSESRINRLANNLSTQLIRDALGSAAKYPDRLVALRQVREAVDRAITLAQAEHLKAETQETEDAKQGPMSEFIDFQTITVKDPSDDKKDEQS